MQVVPEGCERRREYRWCREAWAEWSPMLPPINVGRRIALRIGEPLPPGFEGSTAAVEYFQDCYSVWIVTRWMFPLNATTKRGVRHVFAHEVGHIVLSDGEGGRDWLERFAAARPEVRDLVARLVTEHGDPSHDEERRRARRYSARRGRKR